MDHLSIALIYDGGTSWYDYAAMKLFWDPDERAQDRSQTIDGWAIGPTGSSKCKFSETYEFGHIYGVDKEGKTISEWCTKDVRESESFREGGVYSAAALRSDFKTSEFPFFFSTMLGAWVHETSLVARLNVEHVGDLPAAQRAVRGNARWSKINGWESPLRFSEKDVIPEGMVLPLQWVETDRTCVGALHLRKRLKGAEWLVDYYGVHGFEMKLEGATMTGTVYDHWDLSSYKAPPGSLKLQRLASLPDEEKRGNVSLSVEYGVILGHG